MSTAVLDRLDLSGLAAAPPEMQQRLAAARPGRPAAEQTLGDAIAGLWEGLADHRPTACPLCGSQMAPRYGASGLAPVGGRCTGCDTTIG